MGKTRVAVQSRGPRNTHREGTYLQLGSPAICEACGCVLAYADKRLTTFNTYYWCTIYPWPENRPPFLNSIKYGYFSPP